MLATPVVEPVEFVNYRGDVEALDRTASLEPAARAWIRLKNTARPSANTTIARRLDLATIANLVAHHLGRPAPEWATDRFERALGSVSPADLDPDTLAEAFATYAAIHSPASIRRVMSTWRGFCRWLTTDRNLLESNPIERLHGPAATPWRPKPLSEEDLGRLVAATAHPLPGARRAWVELERALCALLVTAGVRVSEAIAARVGDIHRSPTEPARLHVSGKGGRLRVVPLPPETVAIIDAYLGSRADALGPFRPADPLLVRRSGEGLTRRAVDHLVSGWFRRAGITPPRGALAHSLRHTYATLLVDNGGSLPEVQRLLGHANLATTQAYLDVTAHGLESAAFANPARALLRRDPNG